MKTSITLMVLAIACLISAAKAQGAYPFQQPNDESDGAMKPRKDAALKHRFDIHLNNKNHVIVELSNMALLPAVMNMDSILTAVLTDIAPLKDSLQTEGTTKKVVYEIDSQGTRKIRITNTLHTKSYIMIDNELAVLKTEQDTLIIFKVFPTQQFFKGQNRHELYKITMIVNNIQDAVSYTTGVLNSTVKAVATEYANRSTRNMAKHASQNIVADYFPYDAITPGKSVYQKKSFNVSLTVFGEVALQNVNDRFAPSFYGPSFNFSFKTHNTRASVSLNFEQYFFFEKNVANSTIIQSNSFLNLGYSKKIASEKTESSILGHLLNGISLGYLINRNANSYFERNTFKIRFGGFQYKVLSLTPQFFFHDMLKNLSPSLRLAVAF